MAEMTEIDLLKAEAKELGVPFSPNIGSETLRNRIAAKKDEMAEDEKSVDTDEITEPIEIPKQEEVMPKKSVDEGRKLTESEVRVRIARSLVKCKITNMDPNNVGATTVFAAVHNEIMDAARIVPLNTEIALEKCLLRQIENYKMLVPEPIVGEDGKRTGNFKTIESPMYAVAIL